MDRGSGGSWKLDNFNGRHMCIVPNTKSLLKLWIRCFSHPVSCFNLHQNQSSANKVLHQIRSSFNFKRGQMCIFASGSALTLFTWMSYFYTPWNWIFVWKDLILRGVWLKKRAWKVVNFLRGVDQKGRRGDFFWGSEVETPVFLIGRAYFTHLLPVVLAHSAFLEFSLVFHIPWALNLHAV